MYKKFGNRCLLEILCQKDLEKLLEELSGLGMLRVCQNSTLTSIDVGDIAQSVYLGCSRFKITAAIS